MSNIQNGRLDKYNAGPVEQQQFGTACIEWVNALYNPLYVCRRHRTMGYSCFGNRNNNVRCFDAIDDDNDIWQRSVKTVNIKIANRHVGHWLWKKLTKTSLNLEYVYN